MTTKITTKSGKSVTIRTRNVGASFGVCGQVVARNGRVIAETGICPLGMDHVALERAIALAAKI